MVQVLEPERRLGRLLVERLNLEPPVDIHGIASQFADVEQDLIPANCDAVVVGLGGDRSRPLIVLAADRPPRRRRFSLAHELGHVLIPWHVGLLSCHIDPRDVAAGWLYRQDEAEANRFASEVLIPTRWLDGVVAGASAIGAIFDALEVANVSAPAGCLALVRRLPPGHAVILTVGSTIEFSLASDGTNASLPRRGEQLEKRLITPFASDHATIPFANRSVEWWFFDDEVQTSATDPRSSREMIDAILSQTVAEADRPTVRASIFAIAGHPKGAYGAVSNVDEMHARLRKRFAGRSHLAAVTDHEDFDLFLRRRAEELLDA